MSRNRYPGIQPFSSENQDLFFGRDDDIMALGRLVKLRQQVTLYGKSGLGKSSLIHAGLLPLLELQAYHPIFIRFGSYQEGYTPEPLATFTQSLPEVGSAVSFYQKIEEGEPSLWEQFKAIQWSLRNEQGKEPTILLIFDQFEELFTYPEGVEVFAETLSELLNDKMPRSFRKALDNLLESPELPITEAELTFLESPLQVKALFSVRSDKLSLLDRISDQLPFILRNCYELHPLGPEKAEQAIVAPAGLEGENFKSPRFCYASQALKKMLDFLSQGNQHRVEPFQLQLLCQQIEQQVTLDPPKTGSEGLPEVKPEHLPDLEALYLGYYEKAISALRSEQEQQKARLLVEEGLILAEEERRLTVDYGQIKRQYNLETSSLQQLVDLRLLRAEPNRLGGLSYELSHDSLLAPILRVRNERKAKEAEVRAQAEAKAKMQKRIKNLSIMFGIVLLLTVIGFSALLWQRNTKLTAVSNQILRAYQELGAFVQLDQSEDVLAAEEPLDQALDLTAEIERTRQALQESRKKIESFQQKAASLEEKIQKGQRLSQDELLSFFEESQAGLDSLVAEGPVLRVDTLDLSLNLDIQDEQEKKSRLEAYYREAKRFEERERWAQAVLKYQQILLLDGQQARARTAIERIQQVRKPEQQNDPTTGSKADAPASVEQPSAAELLLARADSLAQHAKTLEEWQAVQQSYETAQQAGAQVQKGFAQAENQIGRLLAEKQEAKAQQVRDSLAREAEARQEEETAQQVEEASQSNEPPESEKPDTTATEIPIPAVVPVKGGTFLMGSTDGDSQAESDEKPQHKVRLSNFYLGKYEVTNEEFCAFLNAEGNQEEGGEKWYNPQGSYGAVKARIQQQGTGWEVQKGYEKHPVIYVSWYAARAYARWLSTQTGKKWRLPTEAEWEYAAGSGMKDRNSDGTCKYPYAGGDNLDSYGWYDDNSGNKTHPVGQKRPNGLGLYDMSGNVWEWCSDRYDSDYYSTCKSQGTVSNPSGPKSGSDRVLRGGSWSSYASFCRVADRSYSYPDYRAAAAVSVSPGPLSFFFFSFFPFSGLRSRPKFLFFCFF
jgi:formylglycine-generating enzyme required for sulfatase activity